MDLVVIDGPNVFNSVATVLWRTFGDAPWLKSYLLQWFDLDRLVLATLGAVQLDMGIVAFHSNKPLGRGACRLEQAEASAFWGRQARNPGCTMQLVDVPSDQRETYAFACSKCGHENQAHSTSEKGVDVELVSYLFTTSQAWDKACIFSKDTDFAPAVRALRGMGKKISCAGVSEQRASALVRGSHHYRELALDFVVQDAAVYAFVRPAGPLDVLVAELEEWVGVTVGVLRTSVAESNLFQDNRQFEIGVAHAADEQEIASTKGRVDGAVASVRGLAELCHWEQRNTETHFLHLKAQPLLFSGYDRYAHEVAGGSRWAASYGRVFDRQPKKDDED